MQSVHGLSCESRIWVEGTSLCLTTSDTLCIMFVIVNFNYCIFKSKENMKQKTGSWISLNNNIMVPKRASLLKWSTETTHMYHKLHWSRWQTKTAMHLVWGMFFEFKCFLVLWIGIGIKYKICVAQSMNNYTAIVCSLDIPFWQL